MGVVLLGEGRGWEEIGEEGGRKFCKKKKFFLSVFMMLEIYVGWLLRVCRSFLLMRSLYIGGKLDFGEFLRI